MPRTRAHGADGNTLHSGAGQFPPLRQVQAPGNAPVEITEAIEEDEDEELAEEEIEDADEEEEEGEEQAEGEDVEGETGVEGQEETDTRMLPLSLPYFPRGADSDSIARAKPVSHLREIGNLASWTVSTHKPGCGVAALRSEDTSLFWQSDGPQPHLLNIHFFKLVEIVHLRVYLDYVADESYTPTKMSFLAGTGYHDLVEFVELTFERPRGWVDVDLSGVSGGPGSGEGGEDILRAFLVQVRVAENHQNGKDTHVCLGSL